MTDLGGPRGNRELRRRRYADVSDTVEIELPKGDVTQGVVRVGDTVRRPHQAQSYAVAAYLDHLASVGFAGAPRFLGIDDRGRDVLTFMEGDVASGDVEPRFRTDAMLVSVARLVLRLMDASAGYVPTDEPFPGYPKGYSDWQLVSHMDVTPQNVVVVDGEATAVVDFDLARPTTRFDETYNTAMHWIPLLGLTDLPPGVTEDDVLRRLRLFADTVGWTRDERIALPARGAETARQSWTRMKDRADKLGGGWARMWSEGVGDLIRNRGAWLEEREGKIVAALLREA